MLIKCEECGKEISDKATTCPNCGSPVGAITAGEMVTELDIEDNLHVKFKATQNVGPVKVDNVNGLFMLQGHFAQKKKGGLMKGVMAFSTMGMSVAAEKLIKSVSSNKKIYKFEDLLSYDLLEDDSLVTSGGVGMALVGGALLGGTGLIAGSVVGKKKSKKIVEKLSIKVTLNDFSNPCIIIPLIEKPVKIQSKEYKNAYLEAQKVLSVLDVITHNK